MMASDLYDIVIVGGSTPSCVLANRLAEEQDLHVLVIEAGDDLTADPKADHPFMRRSSKVGRWWRLLSGGSSTVN
ncbi:putative choline dehydrogenase [Rosellinia necatrix]|uniref:Putative choline dehydrogenase n=1 Tax=Rosellinia necatrix TaxID=77044 RepID=A0A1S8A7Y7_ROSNE|nr:putative choline dehydrogenase [Rosellinia necatrix]